MKSPDNKKDNQDELIFGKNVVLAFLENQPSIQTDTINSNASQVNKIFLASGYRSDKRIDRIEELARAQHVPIVLCDSKRLDLLVGKEQRHQGIVAQISATQYLSLSWLLKQVTTESARTPMDGYVLALLDGIEDPHNLGAIIRVAEAAGVKALLLPARRSALVTGTVAKTSGGALTNLPIVRINNVVQTLEQLKKAGFWIAGLDVKGDNIYFNADLVRPLTIVIGAESKGISRLVQEHCDMLLSIPMLGKTESLNASVAAGIVFFEIVRQMRNQK